jgi:hypothetical protein
MRELATVRTDILVRRWDADQTAWTQNKMAASWNPQAFSRGPDAVDFDLYGVRPYSVTQHVDCNLLTHAGWGALLGGIAGTTIGTKFSGSAGRIGVGTSSTAATAADTALGGDTGGSSTTSYYALVSGAPVITSSVEPATLVFTATFGTSVANFAWNEFGIDNGTASSVTTTSTGYVFINHGISAQGTKASGQTWNLTATLNFGYPSGNGTLN